MRANPDHQEPTSTDIIPAQSESKSQNSIEDVFAQLKEMESAPPDYNEVISLPMLSEIDKERLLARGILPEEFAQGKIKRGILLNAGVVFLNKYGNGEKPLIKATIQGVNYGLFSFLTNDELDQVTSYQQQYPDEFGIGDEQLDELRKDMLIFMSAASVTNRTGPFPSRMAAGHFALVWTLKFDVESGRRNSALVDAYWAFLINKFKQEHDCSELKPDDLIIEVVKDFMNEHAVDLYPWSGGQFYDFPKVRGVKAGINAITHRDRALMGLPSPFLDSGFHFGKNIDITIEDDANMWRLNSLSYHLFSRGLSELGYGEGSWDQSYMTLGEYRRKLFPASFERSKVQEKEVELVSTMRMLDRQFMGKSADVVKQEIEDRIVARFMELALTTVGKPGDERVPLVQKLKAKIRLLKRRKAGSKPGSSIVKI